MSELRALVCSAVYYSGLVKRAPEKGAPFRPRQILHYYLHRAAPVPSLVIDVSASWQEKIEALEQYESQLTRPRPVESEMQGEGKRAESSSTLVSSPSFFEAVMARGRHYGQLIGVDYGRALPLAGAAGAPQTLSIWWPSEGWSEMSTPDRMLKLGISCYPTYGGSGVVATELAKALALEGHEVHLLSYAIPARLATTDDGVFFHRVQPRPYPLFDYPPYSLALATKMVEVAKRHALDLMHVHYAVPNAVSAVLARQIHAPEPLPVVTTLHGTDVTLVGSDPSYLATTRFGVLQSDARYRCF